MLKRKLRTLDADAAAAGGVCEAKLTTFRFFWRSVYNLSGQFLETSRGFAAGGDGGDAAAVGLGYGAFRVRGQIPCGKT